MQSHRYFILHKPYNMVSQFIGNDKVRQLGAIDFNFPEGIHAIGRLDSASEGLLLLTTNKKVTKLLFESKTPHTRTYMVMVQKKVTEETLHQLRNGITFKIKGNKMYTTAPCLVEVVEEPLMEYESHYIKSKYMDYTWLKITLTEGKYHQIRKMVRIVGHRCVRLIRVSIENVHLDNLAPGAVKEIEEKEFFTKLNIVY